MLASKILEKTFVRFPRAVDDIGDMITAYLNEEKEKCKYLVDSVVDMEVNYLFTNDYDYLENYTTFVPKAKDFNQQNHLNNENVSTTTIFIREIRGRIEAYLKLVVRNLRDSIPKIIGYNLVRSIQDNMQIKLYNQLYKNNDLIQSLNEPEEIMRQRMELNHQIKVMRDAQRVIKKDPE